MKGFAINKLGKLEKNKKVKEGDCIFPFKYNDGTGKKEYKDGECAERDKSKKYGKICATSKTPTGLLKTYGYCEKYEIPSSKKTKKSLKKTTIMPKKTSTKLKKTL